ncbi:MAG: EAL domain-containing protein [Deltaproteobacteria bacterium]|nr:EAL domain-containing protein [Deltaproteobacteria bacterium]
MASNAFSALTTTRFTAPKSTSGSVLLIEDDTMVARSIARLLMSEGYSVEHVVSAADAVDRVMDHSFDVVMSDLNLPGGSGVDLLNVVRAYDPVVPLVLMTGMPTVETAIEAVNLGVLEYMVKPATREQLTRVLNRAKAKRAADAKNADVEKIEVDAQVEIARRDAVHVMVTKPAMAAADRVSIANAATVRPPSTPSPAAGSFTPGLRVAFENALSTLAVELDPIVDGATKTLLGFSARMSSSTDSMTTERELIEAAEKLDETLALRKRARELAVEAFADERGDALLFVDVHPRELVDSDLYSPGPELLRLADRIVLQVRGSELDISDLSARASVLRFVGFRIALTDLDADQNVQQISELSPEFVKLDSRLVRGVNTSSARRRIVAALVGMCRALDAVAIADSVSTAEERDALSEAGCSFVQGSLVLHRRGSTPSSRKSIAKTTMRSAH